MAPRSNLYGVIAMAAAGACFGDHLSYSLARTASGRMLDRLESGTKRHMMVTRACNASEERGGLR
ncbi:hypothetical protein AB0P21_17985 [Kribbella sp. NPDC056861]|uniref:hypothetical protein n=1 Tax=Kribbella sp. NPDC056861 TaxID=3154857 RepID=UPI00343E8CF5